MTVVKREQYVQCSTEEELYEQLMSSKCVPARAGLVLADLLHRMSVGSVSEIRPDHVTRVRMRLINDNTYSERQAKCMSSYIELAVIALSEEASLTDALSIISSRPIRNRLKAFLLMAKVSNPSDITYELRRDYEQYLYVMVAPNKRLEYLKAIDQLKLNQIKENVDELRSAEKDYTDPTQILYLPHHPDYSIAMQFYFSADKESLLYDLSLECSLTLRRQIMRMLNHVLRIDMARADRRTRYLLPLRYLFEFCVQRNIEDISRMEAEDEEAFLGYLIAINPKKANIFRQIVNSTQRFLFMTDGDINWNANKWYLERIFTEDDIRINRANPIEKLAFINVHNTENRKAFQEYMRYLLVISPRLSLQTIRGIHYSVTYFLVSLDQMNLNISHVTADVLNSYFVNFEPKLKPENYNDQLFDVDYFIKYLEIKKEIPKLNFNASMLKKKEIPVHHDRSQPKEERREIERAFRKAPEHVYLIIMIIMDTGRRINEVCQIKVQDVCRGSDDTWIHIYQPKMKRYIHIPINVVLYSRLVEYIKKKKYGPNDFIFENTRHGPIATGTVRKQIEKYIENNHLDIHVDIHGLRHAYATDLYEEGTGIQELRELLGHKSTQMTRAYIDEPQKKMQDRIREFQSKTEE